MFVYKKKGLQPQSLGCYPNKLSLKLIIFYKWVLNEIKLKSLYTIIFLGEYLN